MFLIYINTRYAIGDQVAFVAGMQIIISMETVIENTCLDHGRCVVLLCCR
ncbi:hypothetical protein CAter10_4834 [Collimonas arenae]|nr:hypothetical protein CAter10_4834 [Collimonas arenae]